MTRHGRRTTFAPVYVGDGTYRLGDDTIRSDGDKWLAFVKEQAHALVHPAADLFQHAHQRTAAMGARRRLAGSSRFVVLRRASQATFR
jgi:hypothetical protein